MREVILNSEEIREGVEQAYREGGIEECQRKGFNVDEVRPAHPNEVVVFEHYVVDDGLGTIEKKREIGVNPYGKARILLDALTIFALPLWIEQLRTLGIKDSGYWQMVFKERNERLARQEKG